MTEPLHRNALQPGHLINWYRIERILGQGGFGITYLAYDTNLDQQVAIKEYLPIELAVREGDYSVHPVSEAHNEDFRWGLDRFIAEARTLAKFDHPNIVRVLSVFEQNNTAYMVMRYEHGRSLQELLPKRATLEEAQLLQILFPILGGLAKVHAAGFIHRDIKPANIFIRDDGSPVLLDFGSARQALGHETKTLTTLVSPGYAPFEQYYSKSDRQGPWTDIYGLGATLYRVAVGRAPMDSVDRSEGLLKNKLDPYVPAVSAAAGRYSRRFLAAVDHALRFGEAERPPTVEQWAADFEVPEAPTEVAMHPAAAPAPDTAGLQATEVLDAGRATGEAKSAQSKAATAPEPASLYSTFIGPKRTGYYLKRFKAFDPLPLRRRVAWHWPAALMTFPWMMYRRLYLWGVLYPLITVALTFAVLLPISIIGFGGGEIPNALGLAVLIAVAVAWPGMSANAIYHRRAKARIAEHEALNLDPDARLAWLAARGGTSRRAVAIGVLAFSFLALLIAADQHNKAREHQAGGNAAQEEDLVSTEERLHALLDQARQDYEALSLSTPPGNNAVEKLREVLAMDPGNADARAGLRLIVEKYADLARQAAEGDDLEAAAMYLDRALEVAPNSKELRRHRKRLDIAKYLRQGRAAMADGDLDAAQGYLSLASDIAPHAPELRRFRRELARAKARRRRSDRP